MTWFSMLVGENSFPHSGQSTEFIFAASGARQLKIGPRVLQEIGVTFSDNKPNKKAISPHPWILMESRSKGEEPSDCGHLPAELVLAVCPFFFFLLPLCGAKIEQRCLHPSTTVSGMCWLRDESVECGTTCRSCPLFGEHCGIGALTIESQQHRNLHPYLRREDSMNRTLRKRVNRRGLMAIDRLSISKRIAERAY